MIERERDQRGFLPAHRLTVLPVIGSDSVEERRQIIRRAGNTDRLITADAATVD